jgi:hypothetical protein
VGYTAVALTPGRAKMRQAEIGSVDALFASWPRTRTGVALFDRRHVGFIPRDRLATLGRLGPA